MTGPRIYLVAGEPSGDRLGAALIRGLRSLEPGVEVMGVGGRAMAAEGLHPLFDIGDIAVMGLTEVLPRLPLVMRRLRETAADAAAARPDALVTIDAPSFGLRVAERVRRRSPGVRTIHYVAPSVWAWRPGRAAHMARFVDHVLALLPFEPPFMEAAGMGCDFVGHPIAERPPLAAAAIAEARAAFAGAGPLILVAPGSRRGEVARLWPPFADAIERLRARHPGLAVAIPVAETVAADVAEAARGLSAPARLIPPETPETARRAAFAAADAALVKSGTVSLEMAEAGTPHVVGYRASALTAAMVRRLVRIDTGTLVNLVAGGRAIPEFLQEDCRGEALAGALEGLLGGGPARARQRAAFRRTMAILGQGGEPPSLRAARAVLEAIGR